MKRKYEKKVREKHCVYKKIDLYRVRMKERKYKRRKGKRKKRKKKKKWTDGV